MKTTHAALLGLVFTSLAGLSHAQKKPTSAPPTQSATQAVAPCWYAVPGKMQMVNLNHLAEVRVVDDGAGRFRVMLNTSNGHHSRLSEIVANQKEAASMMESIRSTSLECR